MKKTYLLLSILLISTFLFSQKENNRVDFSEIKEYKNHLELDVKRVFQDLAGATIIYKRLSKKQIENKPNTLKLIRYMGRFDNEIRFDGGDPLSSTNNTSTDTDIFTSLSVGIEKQIQFKKMVHYHGVDIQGNVRINNRIRESTNSIGTFNYKNNKSDYSIGLVPFFGIKYYFNNRFSIGAETGVSFGYRFGINKLQNDNIIITNGETTVQEGDPNISTSHEFYTYFSNLRLLSIGYLF